MVIGANADQNGVAPAVTLGSAVIDLPRALLIVARTVGDRQPLPQVFALGAETGVVRFVINERLADRIGTEVRQRLDSAWKEMESGAWRSPVSWTARDR